MRSQKDLDGSGAGAFGGWSWATELPRAPWGYELDIHHLLAIFTVVFGGAVGRIVGIYVFLSA